jgi:hypothetical protein
MKSISEGVNMVTSSNPTKTRVRQSLIQKLGSILASFKLVFSHWTYITLAGTIAVIFWIIFNLFEQLLFIYLRMQMWVLFSQVQQRVLVSMNVYVLKHSRVVKLKNATSFFLVLP